MTESRARTESPRRVETLVAVRKQAANPNARSDDHGTACELATAQGGNGIERDAGLVGERGALCAPGPKLAAQLECGPLTQSNRSWHCDAEQGAPNMHTKKCH